MQGSIQNVTHSPLPYLPQQLYNLRHQKTCTIMKQSNVLLNFGRKLRKLRSSRGVSQENMAGEIGIDRTYYAAVENGKRNVSLRNIKKIALGFKLTLSELFSEVR